MRTRSVFAALCTALIINGCVPAPDVGLIELLAAADRRAVTAVDMQLIRAATGDEDIELRSAAARVLGHLDNDEALELATGLTGDPAPEVRAAAVWALGQLARGETQETAELLRLVRAQESDLAVRVAAAASLGRLPYATPAAVARAEAALNGLDFGVDPETPRFIIMDSGVEDLGVASGVDALLRNNPGFEASERTVGRLRSFLRFVSNPRPQGPRIRARALSALGSTQALDAETLTMAMADPSAEVRRLVATFAGRLPAGPERQLLLAGASGDDDPRVRYAAQAATASDLTAPGACDAVRAALDDPSPHVRLGAIDALGGCSGGSDNAESFLAGLALQLSEADAGTWHAPAHALVALAASGSRALDDVLAPALQHEVWQVRMYAARAAAAAALTPPLVELASDSHPNVRSAAIQGLVPTLGHEADEQYLLALESDDHQLLRTAAEALRGTPRTDEAVAELLTALERTTVRQNQTSRDARRAMLEVVGELGTPAQEGAVTPYLTDFDPFIAQLAATILQGWTGTAHAADPQPLPVAPFPALEELQELATADVTVQMNDGSSFQLQLLPLEAPTNAARFARLARSGYFDGLTFHRVVPNFVIQGGSPGANEYVGAGAFSRDEFTDRSHLRGTVGISTRGRDTGDAQIFVNLVDNVRLDHGFTIFGLVVDGMDAVDAILEGATIATITVDGAPAR